MQSLEKTQNKEFKLTLESRHVAAILELCKVRIAIYLFWLPCHRKGGSYSYLPVLDTAFFCNKEHFDISLCV